MKNHLASGLLCAAAMGVAIAMLAFNAEAQNKPLHQASATTTQRVAQYPRVGHQSRRLPPGNQAIRVNREAYSYYNGSYYRPRPGGEFIVVNAPLGARVGSLPHGHVNFFIGPRHFFYVNLTYYLWDQERTEYIVVEEQRGRDRYECYLWAVDQTGFDQAANNPDFTKASDYRRAISACLEGRGYTVR